MPKRPRLHPERPDTLTRIHVAEPSPLGLFGLAMGCLLLMFVDFEVTSGKLMMVPWVFVLPATLQLVAGIFDFLRHNIFGGTAFIGYAVFWYGLSWVYYLEITYENDDNADILMPDAPSIRQHTGIIASGYLLFSLVLTFIAFGVNRILLAILAAIDLAFLMIICHTFAPEHVEAYWIGIMLILVFIPSMYGFTAILLLKIAGGEVLPIGRPCIDWSDYIMVDREVSRSLLMKKRERRDLKRPSRIATDDEDLETDDYTAIAMTGNHDHSNSDLRNRSNSNSIKNDIK